MSTLVAATTSEPAWLLDVRLRSVRRMLWCRELWARHRHDEEDALAITHSEVELALAGPRELLEAELEFHRSDERAQALSDEIELRAEQPAGGRWAHLCSTLALAPAEQQLLALALAAELVPALRRVFGYLQDESTALDPTPALVAELWGWTRPPHIGAASALISWALAHPSDAAADPGSSTTGWAADPCLLENLLEQYEGWHGPLGELVAPLPGPRLHQRELEEIVCFVEALSPAPRVEIELVGPPGSGATTLASHAAARLGKQLIAVDATAVAAQADPVTAAAREVRGALLAGALIAWQHAGELPAAARRAACTALPLVFLTGEKALDLEPADSTVRRSYQLPPIRRSERIQLWRAGPGGPVPEPVSEWALRPAEIETIARVAPAGANAVRDVARGLLYAAPRELLTPLAQPYTWEDFVAPPRLGAHLKELEEQARARGQVLDDWGLGRLTPLGRGVTALFSGPSGTGKTMAAQVLSRSLGLELYRVDLAGVVNKYIGETEKRLRTLFDACERAPAMLFFDEADALFGRRTQVKDAHDRFANIEIDYLLQRMEEFDGVAVLATNRDGDLDKAFMRRLRFTINFAPPGVSERERLWRLALEGSANASGEALVGEVDWPALARELNLTGAGIKSAALAAAFLARSEGTPIATRHLLAAAQRELEKQGVVARTGRQEAA